MRELISTHRVFAEAFIRLQDFKGINMLADIGNGTMNIMYINISRPVEEEMFDKKNMERTSVCLQYGKV